MRPSNQPPVVRSQDESDYLFETIHKGSHKARVITRARILTKLAMGLKRGEIGLALDVGLTTVDKTPKRFNQGGLQSALSELPRLGPIPKLNAKQAAQITAIACSMAPDGHDHWTLRMLAGKVVELGFADSFSHEAARQLLKKRTQALASQGMVYSGGRRGVHSLHGRRLGHLRLAFEPRYSRRLFR